VGEKPEKKREDRAEEQASNDGKVKGGVLAAVDDVAGEFSKTKGELATEIKETAYEREQPRQEEKGAAEFSERIHDWILPETVSG
jgi:hypothetical protein